MKLTENAASKVPEFDKPAKAEKKSSGCSVL